MKKLQVLFAATMLVAGLAGAVGADNSCCKVGAECCKPGAACCEQQGTKSGWFTGAGSVAKMDNKMDNKAGASCCGDKKMDNKAGASCSDNKAGGCDSKKMDNKAGASCCGDKK